VGMSETAMADDTAEVAPHSIDYDPFHPRESIGARYWRDRNFWSTYKASVDAAIHDERSRCREIVRAYTEVAPLGIRDQLFDLIRSIETPPSNKSRQY
jgi:hypothetical protein